MGLQPVGLRKWGIFVRVDLLFLNFSKTKPASAAKPLWDFWEGIGFRIHVKRRDRMESVWKWMSGKGE